MKATKTILTPSFFVAAYELIEAGADGWKIDKEVPPVAYGVQYEVGLYKEVDENEPIKLSRAEILANARAAKAAKAKESGNE